ncbi:MAG: hypothetical protein KJ072_13455 [Verrucomicrobia bacterium]|nr:hypothetical protein [Verrucomicrobiota bacterium]
MNHTTEYLQSVAGQGAIEIATLVNRRLTDAIEAGASDIHIEATFRRGVGCKECLDTGYQGRTAVTEMLEVNEVLRDAILQKLPTRALQQVAIQQGMRTLWRMGLRRVLTGQITLEEIVRVMAMDEG